MSTRQSLKNLMSMDIDLQRSEMITVNTQIILGSVQRCWSFQRAAVVVPAVAETGQDSRREQRKRQEVQWSLINQIFDDRKRMEKEAAAILSFFLPVKIIY
jgi:hypothetical protein